MQETRVLPLLLAVLDTLNDIAQRMYPRRLPDLVASLGDQDAALNAALLARSQSADIAPTERQMDLAAALAVQASAGLRSALQAENPRLQSYRAMRHYSRALEALAALAETEPEVGRYFLEPKFRDNPEVNRRLAAPPAPDSGVFHFANEIGERGGFSVIVPRWYNAAQPLPVIMALHGGSGHGRLFLWNWLPEARSRGIIVVAPTAIGSTWSLTDPAIDSENLKAILARVQDRWKVDPQHMLLCGMSDGGTFTLLSGLADGSPFTHLAPVAAAFHPLLLAMSGPRRLTGLPVHLTHGALDWMFPVDGARTAYRTLAAAGVAITYREIADLSHAYPRNGQGEVLDWFLADRPTPQTSSG